MENAVNEVCLFLSRPLILGAHEVVQKLVWIAVYYDKLSAKLAAENNDVLGRLHPGCPTPAVVWAVWERRYFGI